MSAKFQAVGERVARPRFDRGAAKAISVGRAEGDVLRISFAPIFLYASNSLAARYL